MSIQLSKINSNLSFKQNDENLEKLDTGVKSDLVSSPDSDEFKKEENVEKEPKKEKHLLRNISLGIVSAVALIYGGVVLKRKLSKPSFEEIQRCFKEIFGKDLSKEQVKDLLKKYKEICKNDNTEEFSRKMIEQLKKDYGLQEVLTDLKITKLKDNKIKTALEQKYRGYATPLGEINIMPSTSSDNLIRSIQSDTFATGFHELKHMKQFADAYRTSPEKFAEAFYEVNIASKSSKEELLKNYYDEILKTYQKLKNGDIELLTQLSKETGVSVNEVKGIYSKLSIDDLLKIHKEQLGLKTDEQTLELIKKENIEEIKKLLDERFGKLERFKEGTEEYKKGLEYIEGYAHYPNSEKDLQAYKDNILEKEAWNVGDLAKKIYKYSSSIWKL